MSVTLTAATILTANGFTTTDIAAADFESKIDNAIGFVNLMAGTSIAKLSGVAGSKTTTVTDNEDAVLSLLFTCILREIKKTSLSNSSSTGGGTSTGKSASAMGFSVSESSSVSSAISAASALGNADDFSREMFNRGLRKLIGHRFERA